jgi:hypothetical protein
LIARRIHAASSCSGVVVMPKNLSQASRAFKQKHTNLHRSENKQH